MLTGQLNEVQLLLSSILQRAALKGVSLKCNDNNQGYINPGLRKSNLKNDLIIPLHSQYPNFEILNVEIDLIFLLRVFSH